MMTGKCESGAPEAKRALQRWAERNGKTPSLLARELGYSYVHAWQLLRGKTPVSMSTVGRMVTVYGPESVAEITAAMELRPATREA